MNLIILLIITAVATGNHLPLGYHASIGIPEAARIKEIESTLSSKISSGFLASLGVHPFFAGLIIGFPRDLVSVCGASLISHTTLVTAALCWNDGIVTAKQFEVVLESVTLFSGGTRITTSRVIPHPMYSAVSLENNIALILIPWVSYSYNIQPIDLPRGLQNSTFVGESTHIIGYGKTGETASITVGQRRRYMFVSVISNVKCAEYFGDSINDTHICTGTVFDDSPCGGDTGGPVYLSTSFRKGYLIGVMSHISPYGCEAQEPAVHTRVTSYIDWIDNNM